MTLRSPLRSHVDEEDLHLGLGDSPSQALAGAEAKAETLEVVGLRPQPAGRLILLRTEKHFGVAAHRVQA